MDPEDWTGIVNEAFDAMSKAIYQYEGTIARLSRAIADELGLRDRDLME